MQNESTANRIASGPTCTNRTCSLAPSVPYVTSTRPAAAAASPGGTGPSSQDTPLQRSCYLQQPAPTARASASQSRVVRHGQTSSSSSSTASVHYDGRGGRGRGRGGGGGIDAGRYCGGVIPVHVLVRFLLWLLLMIQLFSTPVNLIDIKIIFVALFLYEIFAHLLFP